MLPIPCSSAGAVKAHHCANRQAEATAATNAPFPAGGFTGADARRGPGLRAKRPVPQIWAGAHATSPTATTAPPTAHGRKAPTLPIT